MSNVKCAWTHSQGINLLRRNENILIATILFTTQPHLHVVSGRSINDLVEPWQTRSCIAIFFKSTTLHSILRRISCIEGCSNNVTRTSRLTTMVTSSCTIRNAGTLGMLEIRIRNIFLVANGISPNMLTWQSSSDAHFVNIGTINAWT